MLVSRLENFIMKRTTTCNISSCNCCVLFFILSSLLCFSNCKQGIFSAKNWLPCDPFCHDFASRSQAIINIIVIVLALDQFYLKILTFLGRISRQSDPLYFFLLFGNDVHCHKYIQRIIYAPPYILLVICLEEQCNSNLNLTVWFCHCEWTSWLFIEKVLLILIFEIPHT